MRWRTANRRRARAQPAAIKRRRNAALRRALLEAATPALQRLADEMAQSILATNGLANAFRGLAHGGLVHVGIDLAKGPDRSVEFVMARDRPLRLWPTRGYVDPGS